MNYVPHDGAHHKSREDQDGCHHIATLSGKLVDPWNLTPDDVHIDDLAMALSCEPRYIGHNGFHYSVAQHSVILASWYDRPIMKAVALLHDAEEAYLKDMPSPIKARPDMAEYLKACDRARRAIFGKFGVPYALYEEVRGNDNLLYMREREDFLRRATGEPMRHILGPEGPFFWRATWRDALVYNLSFAQLWKF
jgi:hypothetical protein